MADGERETSGGRRRADGERDIFKKYLSVENLLIDNLWVLERRPAAAGEICHLIGERLGTGKFTVLASDRQEEAWRTRNGAIARLLYRGLGIHLRAPRFFAAHVQQMI